MLRLLYLCHVHFMAGKHRLKEIDFTQAVTTNTDIIGLGRNPQQHNMRNLAIAHRYYFYMVICDKNMDKTIELLQQDFFLQEATIVAILQKYADTVKELRKAAPGVKYLNKVFSQFNWEIPAKPVITRITGIHKLQASLF